MILIFVTNNTPFSFPLFCQSKWIESTEWKPKGDMGKFEHTAGEWFVDADVNKGIQTSTDMKFHAISAKLDKPFSNKGKDLVLQFSVKHEKKDYAFCGGGYIKLLGSSIDQKAFGGDTDYHIMFGPDLCGYDVSRIHVIFNYKGENLLKKDDIKLEYADKNEFTHMYTLIVKPDDTYEVLFDGESKSSGDLGGLWDFPARKIDDPEDKKPADWVDEKQIPDPDVSKPEGYDDIPEKIVDPDAEKPEDWSDEDDGEWEAPEIDNPEYKGEWEQPMIDNPEYNGEWSPKQIDNPDYVEGVHAYDDIGSVGFELWTVNSGSIFDNILVTDDAEYAKEVRDELFQPTKDGEKDVKKKFDDDKKAAEDAAKAAEEAEKEDDEADEAAADDADDADDVDDYDEDEDDKDEL